MNNQPLSGLAQLMAMKGRHGDTELVHMSKPEVKGLASLGQLTINPDTGLPEAFSLSDFIPGLAAGAASIASGGALSPLLLAGIAGGTSLAVNRGDFGKAAFDSLLAGAGGMLSSAMMPTKGLGADLVTDIGAKGALDAATMGAQETANQAFIQNMGEFATGAVPAVTEVPVGSVIGHALGVGETAGKGILGAIPGVAGMAMGLGDEFSTNTYTGDELRTPNTAAAPTLGPGDAPRKMTNTLTDAEILESVQGQSDPLRFYLPASSAPVGLYGSPPSPPPPISHTGGPDVVQKADGGGISQLYDGDYSEFAGLVDEGYDGMSDDVVFPVMQDGQKGTPDAALLSKDEYVIDAHTVAALGNGSSNAGARKLDTFVDEIREKVYGTGGKQPKELDGLAALANLANA